MKSKSDQEDLSTVSEQSSSTTQKICEAALRLFGAKGVEGTSIREIADLAQVNPSLISYHFGGKDGLFRALMETIGRAELEVIERILKKPADGAEFKLRLKMFFEELVDVHYRRPEFSVVMAYFFEKSDAESLAIFNEVYMKIFNRILAFFEEAQNLGFANPRIKSIHLTQVVIGGIADIFRMRQCLKAIATVDYEQEDERRALIESVYELCVNGFVDNAPAEA
ncbi:MAG: TetR family transcriptional regulator [Oligoflexus sp.]